MRFSARGYHRVLKVARTLAGLDGNETVARIHSPRQFPIASPVSGQARLPEQKGAPRRPRCCRKGVA
ncbi:hypothetical protein [Rhizobium sp. 57MFTsu3.2]|uniref:magnesium chelatase subunit ChlI family protein n=1 Tax=Rhizobium sp. 57MFTsu3.2 TaxID=1048681 RepID=UPI001FEFE3BC|nr:hypothetical protein [Rhizobium sp. 57MFTsu3.2]